MQLFKFVERPTALLLQCLGLEQVLLGRVAGHFVGRVRLLELVELLADLDFGGRWHGLR